ncbi:hypothetical protein [Pseudothermotoga thermarum]|uniref:Uncharacterized protein n=1 Tax=Pseudothermotoga thermarum DSM 5069 TaxID=688269 RepID=F7YX25_9THEM|nr:hypothetical protein [Pseudothermotoga thermarum]AEH50611.1 hypothetical protein Theth_0522 [Pseudothermotoga thermarum DSM 5069]
MLVIRYPLSLNVARKLTVKDIVKYTGRMILISREAFERIIFYEKAEGLIPEFIMGEIVVFGSITPNKLGVVFEESFEPFLEKIFLFGAVAVVSDVPVVSNHYFKRFARIMFAPVSNIEVLSNRTIAYADLQDKAVREIEVQDLMLRVVIDSEGNTRRVETK